MTDQEQRLIWLQNRVQELQDQLDDRERTEIAAIRQSVDKEARDRADLIGQVAALHERYRYADLDAIVTAEVRKAAKAIFDGNCAFIDDDIHLLAFCTRWALENGLPDDLNPELIPKAKAHLRQLRAAPEPSQDTAEPAQQEDKPS